MRPKSVSIVRPLLIVLVVATGLVVAGGAPAYACSCEAEVPNEKRLGAWISGLCSQVPADELAASSSAGSTASRSGPDWGFVVFAGVSVLALPLAFVVGGARLRD